MAPPQGTTCSTLTGAGKIRLAACVVRAVTVGGATCSLLRNTHRGGIKDGDKRPDIAELVKPGGI